jgi:hypothetical protein
VHFLNANHDHMVDIVEHVFELQNGKHVLTSINMLIVIITFNKYRQIYKTFDNLYYQNLNIKFEVKIR